MAEAETRIQAVQEQLWARKIEREEARRPSLPVHDAGPLLPRFLPIQRGFRIANERERETRDQLCRVLATREDRKSRESLVNARLVVIVSTVFLEYRKSKITPSTKSNLVDTKKCLAPRIPFRIVWTRWLSDRPPRRRIRVEQTVRVLGRS